jgi:hypothetical protein
MANYRRLELDLSVAHDQAHPAPVDGGNGFRGTAVDGVTVISIPGSTFNLHFGQTSDRWDVLAPQSIELCPVELDGIFFSNAAGAGIAVIEVSFASGGVARTA